MEDMLADVSGNLAILIPVLLVLVAAIVFYLVLMVRAIIDMLRHEVSGVLLTFAFLALIPFPLIIIMGIMILIIWRHHKKDILADEGQPG